MIIRKAIIKDIGEIRSLIIRSVDPENNPDFGEEGIQSFLKPNEISSIQDRILSEDYLTLCFLNKGKILGLITIHANSKIEQLFVEPASRN